ncbi:hypothetical protein D3C81_2054930 [compost metagenome]
MQFLNHRFVPRAASPGVLPGVSLGIDHLARALHAFGLVARGRIGHPQLAVDAIAVTVTGLARGNSGIPAICVGQQLDRRLLFQFQAHAARIRRP